MKKLFWTRNSPKGVTIPLQVDGYWTKTFEDLNPLFTQKKTKSQRKHLHSISVTSSEYYDLHILLLLVCFSITWFIEQKMCKTKILRSFQCQAVQGNHHLMKNSWHILRLLCRMKAAIKLNSLNKLPVVKLRIRKSIFDYSQCKHTQLQRRCYFFVFLSNHDITSFFLRFFIFHVLV